MKSPIERALEAGELTYNSGKPCRRGHDSPRYTSNGMCTACVKMRDEARREAKSVSRQRYINARVNNLKEKTFMVRDGHDGLVQRVCDILQYGTSGLLEELEGHVSRIYDTCPHPRALSKDDLLKFIRFDGEKVQNLVELQVIYPTEGGNDPNTYVVRNGLFYRANELMEVLRDQRIVVIPRTPMF
jgi:hypothetical protein